MCLWSNYCYRTHQRIRPEPVCNDPIEARNLELGSRLHTCKLPFMLRQAQHEREGFGLTLSLAITRCHLAVARCPIQVPIQKRKRAIAFDHMTAVEVVDFGAVGDFQVGVAALDPGVFVGAPFV